MMQTYYFVAAHTFATVAAAAADDSDASDDAADATFDVDTHIPASLATLTWQSASYIKV